MSGDHVKLPPQELADCIVASTQCHGHTGIMRPGSDKSLDLLVQSGSGESGEGTDGI